MFLNSRQSQRYPNYRLGLVKNPFTTRNDEKKNSKITPKMRGENEDIWEYAGPVFS